MTLDQISSAYESFSLLDWSQDKLRKAKEVVLSRYYFIIHTYKPRTDVQDQELSQLLRVAELLQDIINTRSNASYQNFERSQVRR